MSTPAEIIAARYEDNVTDSDTSFDEETASMSTSIPSINDEAAFPTLGGGKKPSPQPTSWGPSSNAIKAPKFKSSTIQEAFSLDTEDQLNLAKPEFVKVVSTVSSETKTKIESTVSQHTKKRTFVINGKPEDVKLAKRLIIKKITKGVKLSFNVPSKLRSRIIGPGGKTLKPIIAEYDIKIDIGNEETIDESAEEDDIFYKSVIVTIEGDAESCKLSKAKILSIVNAETKNLSIKVPIDEDLKPFAQKFLQPTIDQFSDVDVLFPDYKPSKDTVTVVGDREEVLKVKELIKSKLDILSAKIFTDEVPIPATKHQFLPIDNILEEFNVLIKLPTDGEKNVKFIGEKSQLSKAKESARQTTVQYNVEVLEMSKANKNLDLVKAIAQYLKKSGFFKSLQSEYNVTINAIINAETVPIEIVNSDKDAVVPVKKAIVAKVNQLTRETYKVINDIDSFLIPKVPSTIDSITKELNIAYVIVDGKITLFNEETDSDTDFVDSNADESFDKVDNELNSLRELGKNLDTVEVEIPAKSQKFVSGPRDCVLNSILGELEPKTVEIKVGDKITLHGIKSQVAIAKKLIEQVVKDGEEFGDKYSTTVIVPTIVLSRLIGKNGSFLTGLREEFGTKIDVEDDKEKSDKSEISIVGYKRTAEACKAKIVSVSKRWADETTETLRIESQYHKRIIGAKGVYINRLQDKYGVRIRFPSAQDQGADAPKTKDEVTIRGPSKSVAGAKAEIEELYKFEKENGFVETIKIPVKAISRVIGKSGETINDIADGFGIEYDFKRDNKEKEEELGYAEVKLTGSKSGLKQAIAKLNEIIKEVEEFVSIDVEVESKYHRDLIGPGGSKMREIISIAGGDDITPRGRYHRLLTIPNEDSGSDLINSQGPKQIVNKIIEQINELVANKKASIVEELDIAKEKHRLIIGPSGSIRQDLEKEFNVSINVPRADNKSTLVKISGLPQNIENAKSKILELTKDDWSASLDVPEAYHALVAERGAIFNYLKQEFNVEVTHGQNLSRKASKLSNSSIPSVDEKPEEDSKFIISELSSEVDESKIIPWRLKGDEESTSKALKFLTERLETAKSSNYQAWFYSSKPSSFSRIIGPSGSTVKKLRESTKTFITVPRASDKNNNYVYLVGTEDALNEAKLAIEKLFK